MAGPLNELKTRISELEADVAFVALAAQLRPRIGEIVQWQAAGNALELVRQFMANKASRPEGLYGPLLIRLLAAFERYMRMLIIQSVEQRATGIPTFDDLRGSVGNRNIVLTGRLLSSIESPREHLTLDIELLVTNLASCRRGAAAFRLNAPAFSAIVTGAAPIIIEKALENLDVSDWWDDVGANGTLAGLLGTKGARATGGRARERLRELWRWRNQLAHGGDEEVALSGSQLRDAIQFVASFSNALDHTVKERLRGR